ncbi:MAG TPA: hypothetical protein VNX25_04720, partial [Verrucomicrobiae bacterium]|nr:hypothetical protein [Verrucomicrobiae bacterium]
GKATFTLRAAGLSAERAAALAAAQGIAVRGGTVSGELRGGAEKGELTVSGRLGGRGLAVVSGGRSLPPASFSADLRLERGTLRVEQGRLSAGEGVGALFSGTIVEALRPERSGSVVVDLQEKALGEVVASLRGFVPEGWQGSGFYSGSVQLALGPRLRTVSGHLSLRQASMENPSQSLGIVGITGRIPLSADLLQVAAKPRRELSYSRENFPQLVRGGERPEGESVSIDRIRMGQVEAAAVTAVFAGADGVTRLRRLEIPLFGGTIVGQGFLRPGRGFGYGFDLLVHDLSLLRLCDTVPGVKGYLSGRVDGVLGVQGEAGGASATTGFMDLWTRSAEGEKMLVSREFLQKLAGRKLKGIFFRDDRPYDRGEIIASLEEGLVTFRRLQLEHTNLLGVKDLNVNVASEQNRIALDHLLKSVREATLRGRKAAGGAQAPPPVETEFNWLE